MPKTCICLHQIAFDRIRFHGVRIGPIDDFLALVAGSASVQDREFVDCPVSDPRYAMSENWKQVCTYGLVVKDGKVLLYERKKNHDRADLVSALSVGIGGHVEPSDFTDNEPGQAICEAIGREIEEELGKVKYIIDVVGLVSEDQFAGFHHVGVVYVARLFDDQEPGLPAFDEELVNPRFVSLDEITLDDQLRLEPWSVLLIAAARKHNLIPLHVSESEIPALAEGLSVLAAEARREHDAAEPTA